MPNAFEIPKEPKEAEAKTAYSIYRGSFRSAPPPHWDDLDQWMRDALQMTYQHGALNQPLSDVSIPIEDKDRPIIVHALALLIQHRTNVADDVAVALAWELFELFGRPKTFPARVTDDGVLHVHHV